MSHKSVGLTVIVVGLVGASMVPGGAGARRAGRRGGALLGAVARPLRQRHLPNGQAADRVE